MFTPFFLDRTRNLAKKSVPFSSTPALTNKHIQSTSYRLYIPAEFLYVRTCLAKGTSIPKTKTWRVWKTNKTCIYGWVGADITRVPNSRVYPQKRREQWMLNKFEAICWNQPVTLIVLFLQIYFSFSAEIGKWRCSVITSSVGDHHTPLQNLPTQHFVCWRTTLRMRPTKRRQA